MRHTSARPRRRRADRGFTLIELVISISVMGLICTVIAAVVTTAFTNNPMVEIRTDTAHTLKGLVTWLPQDVDSTPPDGFDLTPATATGCASNPGKNVLRMEWNEIVNGTNTRYIAAYRWLSGTTTDSIVRVTCSGTGAGPLGNTHTLAASGPLMKMTAGWAQGSLPVAVAIDRDLATNDVVLVTFDVQTAAGDIMHVDSAPKNPAHTLPPTTADIVSGTATTVLATTTTAPSGTTTTVAGTTTSTSSTTTTTLPPCVVTGVSQTFATVKNTDPNGNGKAAVGVGVLASALTINLTVSGFCTSIDARAVTGAPNSELFRNFNKLSATSFTVTFPGYTEGSSELWADGTRTITFQSPNSAVLGSTQLVVK